MAGHEFTSPPIPFNPGRGFFRPTYAEIAGLSFLDFTVIPGASTMLLDKRVLIAPDKSSLDGSDITVLANGLDIYWGKGHQERVSANGNDIVETPSITLNRTRYVNVGDRYRISYVSSTDRLVSLQVFSHFSFNFVQAPYKPYEHPRLLRRLANGHISQPHTG